MKLLSNIDTAQWLRPTKDALLVRGWAFPVEANEPAWIGIHLTSGLQSYPGYYGTSRPDVQQAYPGQPAALLCGYSFLVFSESLSFPCQIEAVDAAGGRHLIATLEASRLPVPPSAEQSGTALAEKSWQEARQFALIPGPGQLAGKPAPRATDSQPVLFVSHDYAYAGAQLILLRFLRWLNPRALFPIEILIDVPRNNARFASATEQKILDGFFELAPVHFLSDLTGAPENLPLIRAGHYSLIYANTGTLGSLLAAIQPCTTPVLSHIYELAFWIERRTGRAVFERQATHTDRFIACSQSVRDVLVNRLAVAPGKIDVVYACVSTERAREAGLNHTRESVRRELGIPLDAFVVQACGTFDWRKGAELFVPLCVILRRRLSGRKLKAIWIGDPGTQLIKDQFEYEVESAGLVGQVELVAPQQDLPRWMIAADCFALLSREDPFPMVMLEAGALGLPVVGFDGSGGVKEYAEAGAGLLAPYLDLEKFAEALVQLADQPDRAWSIGEKARLQVAAQYDHDLSFQKALDLILSTRTSPLPP